MTVAYVAGPYRAKTVYETRQNIRRAEDVAAELWKLGFTVLCPHKNSALMDGLLDDSVWLQAGLELMMRCDLVVMVPGWQESEGSVEERGFAKHRGQEVYEWPAHKNHLATRARHAEVS